MILCASGIVFAQTPGGALPPAIASAGVTQAEWTAIRTEVSRQAHRANVSEAALLAAAEAAGANLARSGHFDALALEQTIFEQLAQQADQIAELQHRLDTLTGDADPQIARIYADARTALNDGRLTDADRLLAQASEHDLVLLQHADAEVAQRRLRAGDTIAARGQVAYIQADYSAAAGFFGRAADTVPQSAIQLRWRYVWYQASMFAQRAQLFGEPEASNEALRLYHDVALPLAPREARATDWAKTQNDMGVALRVLGEHGNNQALYDSVAALRAALTVWTRANDPADWASAQNNLGGALLRLGERGDDRALHDAIAALRAALTVWTRARDPADWALAEGNLGAALETLGERGDIQALHDSIAAYRAALEVNTRESAPEDWARDQTRLGNALRVLGERGDPNALHEAVSAYRAALEVDTRARAPASWATHQGNLGTALEALGERGDNQALHDAVDAYRAALEVNTRESAPEDWARDQTRLGNALRVLGERGDPNALHE
ncbi:MAG: hypothetical protein ABUS57_02130, partial [Pseudomonadota bacterium]